MRDVTEERTARCCVIEWGRLCHANTEACLVGLIHPRCDIVEHGVVVVDPRVSNVGIIEALVDRNQFFGAFRARGEVSLGEGCDFKHDLSLKPK